MVDVEVELVPAEFAATEAQAKRIRGALSELRRQRVIDTEEMTRRADFRILLCQVWRALTQWQHSVELISVEPLTVWVITGEWRGV